MNRHKRWRDQNRQHINAYSRQYVTINSDQRAETTRAYRLRVKQQREHFVKEIVRTARTNARKRKIAFEISFELVNAWITVQSDRCALTGFQFDYTVDPQFRTRPFAPSIDRKDNAKGYVPNNIQIVCCIVNRAKNEFTQEMFDAMCVARARQLNG